MRSFGLALLAGASVLATACASNPPPEPTPPPVVAETPRVAPTPPAPIPTPPQPTGPAAGSKGDFAAKSTDRVYFDYDQYNLDDSDRRSLATQITWLKQFPSTRVEVQGHADERGTREYNLALGARRANAVKEYMVSLGVSAARVDTVSYGKERPMCAESNEACWGQNRRGITVVAGGAGS